MRTGMNSVYSRISFLKGNEELRGLVQWQIEKSASVLSS